MYEILNFKKLKPMRILYITLLVFASQFVNAWGEQGHSITATVAHSQLKKSVKDSLKFYLGEMTIQQGANWMDNIRKDTTYDYLKPLHYVNIEKGKNYETSDQGNIVNELNRVISSLKNREGKKKEEIALDLKILLHLMGDLHQPLHCGYGEDRGGNSIKVDFMGKESNLHRVWDTDIIKYAGITEKKCLKQSVKLKRTELLSLDQSVVEWVNDSRSYLDQVYTFDGKHITTEYVKAHSSLIKNQLTKGGVRLAKVLNEIFGA